MLYFGSELLRRQWWSTISDVHPSTSIAPMQTAPKSKECNYAVVQHGWCCTRNEEKAIVRNGFWDQLCDISPYLSGLHLATGLYPEMPLEETEKEEVVVRGQQDEMLVISVSEKNPYGVRKTHVCRRDGWFVLVTSDSSNHTFAMHGSKIFSLFSILSFLYLPVIS